MELGKCQLGVSADQIVIMYRVEKLNQNTIVKVIKCTLPQFREILEVYDGAYYSNDGGTFIANVSASVSDSKLRRYYWCLTMGREDSLFGLVQRHKRIKTKCGHNICVQILGDTRVGLVYLNPKKVSLIVYERGHEDDLKEILNNTERAICVFNSSGNMIPKEGCEVELVIDEAL